MKLYGKDYGPDFERCPACLGHGFIPVMPGAHLSMKVGADSTCKHCKGEGVVHVAPSSLPPNKGSGR
jgi:hypothetical protein